MTTPKTPASSPKGSESATATSGRCATSTWPCPRAPCSACWATTAPARPRPCASSPRCCSRPRAAARVAGHDVVAEAATVRTRIGLAGQQATVDGLLTAPREPRDGRPPLPPAARRRARSGRGAARAPRPHRRGRPTRADLLWRHAPPPRPGRQPRRHPARALPRRADDGPRSAQPHRAVGAAARARARRRDDAAHDAVPRGGRPPGRRHRRARRRARGRRRARPRSSRPASAASGWRSPSAARASSRRPRRP